MLDDLRISEYTKEEAKQLNPLQLAFIGDGVFEIFVRNEILYSNKELLPNKMHKEAIKFVKAKSQAEIIHKLEDELNEDEMYIYKRGRNAKSATVPKNADVRDYRMATGFEALVGYLYLTGEKDRLSYIFDESIKLIKLKGVKK
ncbi:MAG: Mini-ribonuclease 3 [Clostridium sp.]|nr:Mini-ribonuclease 3 [Clostridium sp.]MDY3828514.1 ribonuclease III domain-containing protein [Clostridium sp.]